MCQRAANIEKLIFFHQIANNYLLIGYWLKVTLKPNSIPARPNIWRLIFQQPQLKSQPKTSI